MEEQNTLNSQDNNKQNDVGDCQIMLQSHSNKNSMVLAQTQEI